MTIQDLKVAIEKSWSRETSYSPDNWNANNPAFGQCAVTALVINDYLGGQILNCEVTLPNNEKISHYFNFINNSEIDLTKIQFPIGSNFSKSFEKKKDFDSVRDYMLSNSNTKSRYELLKTKVSKIINNLNTCKTGNF